MHPHGAVQGSICAQASACLALPISSTVYKLMGITIHNLYPRPCNALNCTHTGCPHVTKGFSAVADLAEHRCIWHMHT